MKFLTLLFILFAIPSVCQVTYKKGYFIDNSGEKTECFIKDLGWQDNPTEFDYRLQQDGQSKTASIKTVQEFSIDGLNKFIRALVDIDISRDEISQMSTQRNPEFQFSNLFLKVVVEGSVSLYSYQEDNLTKFFYKTPNTVYILIV